MSKNKNVPNSQPNKGTEKLKNYSNIGDNPNANGNNKAMLTPPKPTLPTKKNNG